MPPLAELDIWIKAVRKNDAQIRARLRAMFGSTRASEELKVELQLLESILDHYDRFSREELERAERLHLLDSLHHGIQHCAQNALDAGDDSSLGDSLSALAFVDERLRSLATGGGAGNR